jgi:predicted acetyltransferase
VTPTPRDPEPAVDEYSLRTATADDFDEAQLALSEAFSEDWEADGLEVERRTYEPARTLLAVRDDEIAGVAGAYTRDLTVPGGIVPAAHVTWVGVRPTHRRRGLLTRMMRRQLADIRALGEPVAVLWASEGSIYQRFGYALGASRLTLETDRELRLLRPAGPGEGRLRSVRVAEAADVLSKVYDLVRTERVGWSSRDARWWDTVLADPPSRREGRTSPRVTVHEGQSGVDGYAIWRTKPDWSWSGPKGAVMVREVAAANPDAYRALWRLMLDVDLTRSVKFSFAAPDEPLYHLVNEPRKLGARLQDGLWVRLVDVPAALAARRYLAPVDVVLEVADPLLTENSGRWHLVGDPDSASCTRTDRVPDLALDGHALSAAYLGGVALSTLAAGGRVTELVPGSLARASVAFGWHRPPSPTEVF